MKTKLPLMVSSTSTPLTTIYNTTNYSMFGFIGGNRNVNSSNLKKITDSLTKKHIKTNAIICILDESDEEQPLKIVDGQHRFESCKLLNIPVSYVIDESLTMETILNDITLMNTASKEWDVSDFMNSEAQKGNNNYILYRDIFTKYSGNFDHEAFFYILNNSGLNKTKLAFPMFKKSQLKFDISDYNYLDTRLQELSQFNIFCELGGKRYYQKSLNLLLNTKGFNKSKMLTQLQSRVSTIQKCNTVDGALQQVSNIYNFRQRKDMIGFNMVGKKVKGITIQ